MILTVTPNPAIDLTWCVGALSPGETQRVPAGVSRAGGKGLNVARVLHATAHRVTALATAGGSTGAELRADLSLSAIPHRLVPVTAPTRRTVTLVDDATGEASVLAEVGRPLTRHEAAMFADLTVELGRTADAVAISGSLPPGFGPAVLGDIVERLVAEGIPVAVDTSGAGLLSAARAGARVLKPNRDELRAATGHDHPLEGARYLIGLGAKFVLVSLGAEGLVLVGSDSEHVHARLPRVLRGNPTGAGDAVVAAIASALASRKELAGRTTEAVCAREDLVRRSVAWSASAVLTPIAGSLSPEHATLADEVVIETEPGPRR